MQGQSENPNVPPRFRSGKPVTSGRFSEPLSFPDDDAKKQCFLSASKSMNPLYSMNRNVSRGLIDGFRESMNAPAQDATRSGDLDFRNATQANLDRNMSDFASVYSVSRCRSGENKRKQLGDWC
jgi:hypothetical protein